MFTLCPFLLYHTKWAERLQTEEIYLFLVCTQAAALEKSRCGDSSEMSSPPNIESSHEGYRIKVSLFTSAHFLHIVLQGKSKWLFIREWFRRLYLIQVLAWWSGEIQPPTMGNLPVAYIITVRYLEKNIYYSRHIVLFMVEIMMW